MWRPNQQDGLEQAHDEMQQLLANSDETNNVEDKNNMWMALGSSPLMVLCRFLVSKELDFTNSTLKFRPFTSWTITWTRKHAWHCPSPCPVSSSWLPCPTVCSRRQSITIKSNPSPLRKYQIKVNQTVTLRQETILTQLRHGVSRVTCDKERSRQLD